MGQHNPEDGFDRCLNNGPDILARLVVREDKWSSRRGAFDARE